MSSREYFMNKVGVASCEKGKAWLRVGSDPLAEVKVPLWVAVGRGDGPVLTVTAGVHGCEYAGILAAIDVFVGIDASVLNGTLVVVPVCNPVSFSRFSQYVNPIDNLNLNRVFPGDRHGSFSQRLASALFNEVICKSDYHIDLHGGDLFEQQLPHVKYYVSGDRKVDDKSRHMAFVFSTRFVQPVAGEEGLPGALFVEAAKRGIPSIISEAGSEGKISEDDVAFHRMGVLNVMRHLRMLSDKEPPDFVKHEVVRREIKLRAHHGGIFIPEIRVGDRVEQGRRIGEVKGLNGDVVESVISPVTGILRMLFTKTAVNTGDPLMILWETETWVNNNSNVTSP